MTHRRTFVSGLLLSMAAIALSPAQAQVAPKGDPIKIGGSLPLTGPLSATGLIHKLVGEIYVDDLNKRGGLLGRPVEWVLKDDQSKPDLARTLYEQLITGDKVDLLIGPYGTGNILSAMGVAQRYSKTLVHHTFGIPSLAKYEQQFLSWPMGIKPQVTVPNMLLDALEASGQAPKTFAVVSSKFPSVQFVANGAREELKKRGLKEVLALEWDFGNRDYGPIAGRLKEANPDLIFAGSLGLEPTQLLDAMKKIDYQPRWQFYLYPAPGPLANAAEGKGALSVAVFENHAPFTDSPLAANLVKTFKERAAKANLPDTDVETQAATSFAAWQIIEAAVNATKSLDDKKMAEWLRKNRIDTIVGTLRFDEAGNFGDDLQNIKQVQNGKWVVVWPAKRAAPNAKLMTP
ncbi:MAG: amino acid ABC transporter substrate-binding protein [Variovorax sp.]